MPAPGRWATAGLAGALFVPFAFMSAGGLVRAPLAPPAGIMAQAIDAHTYRLRLVAQPPAIALDWFGPYGDGRHHTLPVCMRYRGIDLDASEEPGVFTDGTTWMREFFLQRGDLLLDYPAYLRHTFLPFSPAGVHLIASAPVSSMSARSFAEAAERLARDLHHLERGAPAALSARLLD